MAATIINVINNKGGTGKTTTSVNLAAGLALLNKEVLLVDLDSQRSASLSLGYTDADHAPSIMEALGGQTQIRKLVMSTEMEHLSIICGGLDLASCDIALANVPSRERLLARELALIEDYFDFIVLDSPPSLSTIFVNSIIAADYFIVPIIPEYLAYEGFKNLMEVIKHLKWTMKARLELLGILLTMLQPVLSINRKMTKEIMAQLEGEYGEYVFKTRVVRSPMLNEAPACGKSIFKYAPNSVGARDYERLAKEVVERCEFMGVAQSAGSGA